MGEPEAISVAARNLREWRKNRRIDQKTAGKMFGISQPIISDYEAGRKIPRMRIALDIERVTAGEVSVAAWYVAAPKTIKAPVAAAPAEGTGGGEAPEGAG